MSFGEDMGLMGVRVETENGERSRGFFWEKGKPLQEFDDVVCAEGRGGGEQPRQYSDRRNRARCAQASFA